MLQDQRKLYESAYDRIRQNGRRDQNSAKELHVSGCPAVSVVVVQQPREKARFGGALKGGGKLKHCRRVFKKIQSRGHLSTESRGARGATESVQELQQPTTLYRKLCNQVEQNTNEKARERGVDEELERGSATQQQQSIATATLKTQGALAYQNLPHSRVHHFTTQTAVAASLIIAASAGIDGVKAQLVHEDRQSLSLLKRYEEQIAAQRPHHTPAQRDRSSNVRAPSPPAEHCGRRQQQFEPTQEPIAPTQKESDAAKQCALGGNQSCTKESRQVSPGREHSLASQESVGGPARPHQQLQVVGGHPVHSTESPEV